ncbi:MAG: hypothetical protein Q8S01_07835 [Ignavibacteria bacterium]|nr:hypothetical protein [Ignavibacteria bacterium]
MKLSSILLSLIFFSLLTNGFAQTEHTRPSGNNDPRHSVFGPPMPAAW